MKKTSFNLTNKIILVIGGTSGLGHALSLEYAEYGANVVATGRRKDKCKQVYEDILSTGAESLYHPIDIRNHNDLVSLRDNIVEKWGRIDVLVNTAGITIRKEAISFSISDYDSIMTTNARAAFECCQIFGKQMIAQKSGNIINFSSMGAFLGLTDIVPYCASKGAVTQMSKGLAVEWAKYNIRVNCIAPGYFKTELTSLLHTNPSKSSRVTQRIPMKRWGELNEILGAGVFLASDSSSYITGTVIPVDGGLLSYGI